MLLQILTGMWRAVLLLPDAELPFNFEIRKEEMHYVMIIQNAEERIKVDEIIVNGDSLYINLPVYESQFRIQLKGNTMSGNWINYARKEVPSIPFHAEHNNLQRFLPSKIKARNYSGRWETWMDVTDKDSSLAIGVFKQSGNHITGTFLQSGGDHRYLEGTVYGDTIWMSTSDGSHCWLYRGIYKDGQINGTFWSGNHYKSLWHANRNNRLELPDPNKSASVSTVPDFIFPNADSIMISKSDDRYKSKALIIQIMGTWCPNCLDETAFLAEYYAKNQKKELEIIGLDFEKTTDFARISNNIKRLIKRYKVEYEILYAGSVGREEVMKKIPGLENFKSYPTTIYINRQGEVVKVYSGFSGPATGKAYEDFITEFESTIEKIIH